MSLLRSTLLKPGFLRDFAVTAGMNLFLLGVGVLTGALTARLLGPAGRGQLAAIQLWALFLLNLGSLGVPDALVYFSGREPKRAGAYVGSAWAIMLPASLGWMIVAYIVLPYLLTSHSDSVVFYARLFLLILPLAYISRGIRVFEGLRRFTVSALFRAHKQVTYAMGLVVIGLMGAATPGSLTILLLAASSIGPVLAIGLLYRYGVRVERPYLDRIRQLLHYGSRSVLGSVPEDLNTRLDQLLMAVWLTDAELGLYVVAVSWSMVLGPLVRAVSTVAFPYVAGASGSADSHRTVALSTRGTLSVILVINVLLLLITPLAIPLLFGREYEAAIPAALLLLVASSFYALKLVLAGNVRGLGHPEATAYAEVASLLTTIVLLLFLLRSLGIMGAAIASTAAYFVSVAILLRFVLRRTPLSWRELLLITRRDIERAVANIRAR